MWRNSHTASSPSAAAAQLLGERIRQTAQRQLSDPRFAEFCITHVTDPSLAFLYGGLGAVAYSDELRRSSEELAGLSGRKRGRDNDDDAVYRIVCAAAAAAAGRSTSAEAAAGGRAFYFASRVEFDVVMGMTRRAVGLAAGEGSGEDSAAAMEALAEFMCARRTRTTCFLQMLAAVSLQLWRREQQQQQWGARGDVCHVQCRGRIFHTAVMLLLYHATHVTWHRSQRGSVIGRAPDVTDDLLVYSAAFVTHMPLITSLASHRCPGAAALPLAAACAAADAMRDVAATVQSLDDGCVVPAALLGLLRCALSKQLSSM